MFFPEQLYQLSQRDQQVTWLDPFLDVVITSAAALAPVATIQVPEGRALLLQHAAVYAAPGAGQISTSRVVYAYPIVESGAENVLLAFNQVDSAIAEPRFESWQGNLILPSQWRIEASATFDAAVAANVVRLIVAGLLIPLGNIQRV